MMSEIGLPQHAEKLMKKGYDDLLFLQKQANLDVFAAECHKLKIPPGHLDRILHHLRELRQPPAPLQTVVVASAPPAECPSALALVEPPPAFSSDAVKTKQPSKPVYTVVYSQVRVACTSALLSPSHPAPPSKSELRGELRGEFAPVQLDASKYNGDMKFQDKEDPTKLVEAYTYQKKLYLAATDMTIQPPDGTGVLITSQHRRIGKTKMLEYLRTSCRAIEVTGVDEKKDKKVMKEMLSNQMMEERHVVYVNLLAEDSRLSKKELYTNIESYTDGSLATIPDGGLLLIEMGNSKFQCAKGEVGEHLSASRASFYVIVGVGEMYFDKQGEPRYPDYDIIVDEEMHEKMLGKAQAKFEEADASKVARELGIDKSVCVFFKTFETFEAKPKDLRLMKGIDMANILIGKNECFKELVSGKTQQFEQAKFVKWLKKHGQATENPSKYLLQGGSLGEMTIEMRNSSGTPKYNLQERA